MTVVFYRGQGMVIADEVAQDNGLSHGDIISSESQYWTVLTANSEIRIAEFTSGAHRAMYITHFQYESAEELICEVTGFKGKIVEIHHIDPRGMGGRTSVDRMDNLMALHPAIHRWAEDNPLAKGWFKNTHDKFLVKPVPYADNPKLDDEIWFEILQYMSDLPIFNGK
jgi:hypothetical protein